MPHIKSGGIVGQGFLQKRQGRGAPDNETAHVRHIEKAGLPAGHQVLVQDAFGILHRHVPAAEIDHCGTKFLMKVMQYGFHEFRHGSILSLVICTTDNESTPTTTSAQRVRPTSAAGPVR